MSGAVARPARRAPADVAAMFGMGNGRGRVSRLGSEFRVGDIRCCPLCTATVSADGSGIVQEYWVAEDRYFDLWCAACQRHVTLVFADRVVTREPAGNPHDHP